MCQVYEGMPFSRHGTPRSGVPRLATTTGRARCSDRASGLPLPCFARATESKSALRSIKRFPALRRLDDEYYFLPADLEYENDASLRRAVSQTRLREWLSLLPLRSLLLLDTCRAGNVVQLAARSSRDEEALARLIRLSHRAVIVATSADRIALEGHQGHGVFSWAVLDALRTADYDSNGKVDVTDIATHVRKWVPTITEQKFKYRQIPMQDTPGEPFPVGVPE